MGTLTMRRLGILLTAMAVGAVASEDSSTRVEAIATRMYCNCGCGQMLSECSHVQCKRKAALKQEIAGAIAKGETDGAILDQMGAKYGVAILAAPPFRGLNVVLWIFPLILAVIAVGVMTLLWKNSRKLQRQDG